MSSEASLPGAVVFDFDGTLIDTRDEKIASYVEAFEEVFGTGAGVRRTIASSCRETMGANRFVQLDDTLARLSLSSTPEQRQRWSRLYSARNKERLAAVREFPSVREVLQELTEAGFRLFAASGILEEEFLGELRRHGLEGYFAEARGGDKLGFLQALRERGYASITFVGDTGYDRRTAEEAGVPFFRVESDPDLRVLPQALGLRP